MTTGVPALICTPQHGSADCLFMTSNSLQNEETATASIFDKPLHVIPLGIIRWFEGENHRCLTVSNRVGGKKRSDAWLKDEYFDLLATIDITVADRVFTEREHEILNSLARENMVHFFDPTEDIRSLDLLMVVQQKVIKIADIEAGLRLWFDEERFFDLSWLGERLARAASSAKSVGEIIGTITDDLVSDKAAADFISDIEAMSGETFSEYMQGETLRQLQIIHEQNYMSFEPGVYQEKYDVDIFDSGPLHVIALGTVFPEEGGGIQLAVDRGFKSGSSEPVYQRTTMGPEQGYVKLLESLDPTVNDRKFTELERALLWWMGNEGYVSLVKVNNSYAELDVIPVPRKSFFIKEVLDDGFLCIVADAFPDGNPTEDITMKEATPENSFVVSDLFQLIHGYFAEHITLGEMLAKAEIELLKNEEFKAGARMIYETSGLTVQASLMEEAFWLIKQLGSIGAMSFEPGIITDVLPTFDYDAAE